MAERGRIRTSDAVSRITALASCCLKPLSHLSTTKNVLNTAKKNAPHDRAASCRTGWPRRFAFPKIGWVLAS